MTNCIICGVDDTQVKEWQTDYLCSMHHPKMVSAEYRQLVRWRSLFKEAWPQVDKQVRRKLYEIHEKFNHSEYRTIKNEEEFNEWFPKMNFAERFVSYSYSQLHKYLSGPLPVDMIAVISINIDSGAIKIRIHGLEFAGTVEDVKLIRQYWEKVR